MKFTRGQRRILFFCVLCYTAAYTGRLNLSAALVGLKESFQMSDARAGGFQTAFALVYAAGQIVNGARADRVSPRRHIALGLTLSALCNLLFGLSNAYGAQLALWMLNGAAQSMLWTPIVRLTAQWFRGERRTRASFVLSMTIVAGHLLAWGVAGAMSSLLGWRYSFLIPAGVLALAALAAWRGLTGAPEEAEADEETVVAAAQPAPMGRLLMGTGLGLVLLCGVCNGFVRDGVVSWGPTILAETRGGAAMNPTLLSLVIPALNLLGMLSVRACFGRLGSPRRATGVLMLLCAVMPAALAALDANAAVRALLLGLCCAACYGVNPMLTTLIPMEYEPAGRVGLAAGLADSFIYLGSALAGTAAGALSDRAGWPGVFAAWTAASVVGALLAFASARGVRKIGETGKN